MGKVIAIGGGFNGGDFDGQLEGKIRSFIELEKPKVVFIPYGSIDFEENYGDFEKIYRLLGCEVHLLEPGKENLLLEADLIYLGRGGTIPLLEKLTETDAISLLNQASRHGALIAGFSAGAHALSAFAGSNEEDIGFILVKGIGMINGTIMSHYNYPERAEAYHKLLRERNLNGIGLDDHSMLIVENNTATLYSSKADSYGYLIKADVSQQPTLIKTGEKVKLHMYTEYRE